MAPSNMPPLVRKTHLVSSSFVKVKGPNHKGFTYTVYYLIFFKEIKWSQSDQYFTLDWDYKLEDLGFN